MAAGTTQEQLNPNIQRESFDYEAFQRKLIANLRPSTLSRTKERILNAAMEMVGKRPKEAKMLLLQDNDAQPIVVFQNVKGETMRASQLLDPEGQATDNPLKVAPTKGDDFTAGINPNTNELIAPIGWFGNDKTHQGLKLLHELGHVVNFKTNPGEFHRFNDMKIQHQMAIEIAKNQNGTLGGLIAHFQSQIDQGNFSNLGMPDKETRDEYIESMAHRIYNAYKQDFAVFSHYFQQNAKDAYLLNVKLERDAWAQALKMNREARRKGFIIDNRPTDEIFQDIDRSLATRINPYWTFAVRNPESRKQLGLPQDVEKKPKTGNFTLEDATSEIQLLEQVALDAAQATREYLGIDKQRDIRPGEDKETLLKMADSRVMVTTTGFLFSTEEKPVLTRPLEEQVRTCLLAWQAEQIKRQARWLREFSSLNIDIGPQNGSKEDITILGNVKISNINGIPGRHEIHFKSFDMGDTGPAKRIESTTLIYDEKIDLSKEPAPIALDTSRFCVIFARRKEPKEGYSGTLQVVGSVSELWKQASRTSPPNLEKVLTDRGFDPKTAGEVWTAFGGSFVGFRREKGEVEE